MKRLDEETIRTVRDAFPKGMRVILKRTDNPQAPPIDTIGTVMGVDDVGQVMVNWDDGSRSNVAPFLDECWIVLSEGTGKRRTK